MDVRTPLQICLGALLAAISISVLGLAADNISYVNKRQFPSPVPIHYTRWNETAHAQYSYWVTIDYQPSRFSLGTMHAMLAACIICGLVGVGVAVASWTMRGTKALQTSFSLKKQEKRSLPLLPTTLILTTIAFLLSLAVAIYVWQPVMKWPINFHNSLPYPPSYSASHRTGPVVYQAPFDYTPEVWNCLLSPYVVEPTQSRKLHSLCREAGVARYLMLPVLILSAALLFCLIWTWRKARLAAAAEAEKVEAKDVEEVSVQGKE